MNNDERIYTKLWRESGGDPKGFTEAVKNHLKAQQEIQMDSKGASGN